MDENRKIEFGDNATKLLRLVAWLLFWSILLSGGCHYTVDCLSHF